MLRPVSIGMVSAERPAPRRVYASDATGAPDAPRAGAIACVVRSGLIGGRGGGSGIGGSGGGGGIAGIFGLEHMVGFHPGFEMTLEQADHGALACIVPHVAPTLVEIRTPLGDHALKRIDQLPADGQ